MSAYAHKYMISIYMSVENTKGWDYILSDQARESYMDDLRYVLSDDDILEKIDSEENDDWSINIAVYTNDIARIRPRIVSMLNNMPIDYKLTIYGVDDWNQSW